MNVAHNEYMGEISSDGPAHDPLQTNWKINYENKTKQEDPTEAIKKKSIFNWYELEKEIDFHLLYTSTSP